MYLYFNLYSRCVECGKCRNCNGFLGGVDNSCICILVFLCISICIPVCICISICILDVQNVHKLQWIFGRCGQQLYLYFSVSLYFYLYSSVYLYFNLYSRCVECAETAMDFREVWTAGALGRRMTSTSSFQLQRGEQLFLVHICISICILFCDCFSLYLKPFFFLFFKFHLKVLFIKH